MRCAVTGKRKRQENFQSRKRQTPAAPAGTSNHAASTEHITANLPEVAAALDAQLNQPVQQKADAAVNAVGASTPSSAAPSTMQSVAQQINLVTPSNQLQPQLQDVALPEPTADEINPTLTSITSPSPASQTDVQATRSSNGQGNVPGLQDSAQGSRQGQPRPQRYVVAKPVNDARGHTGYLTFARRSVDD